MVEAHLTKEAAVFLYTEPRLNPYITETRVHFLTNFSAWESHQLEVNPSKKVLRSAFLLTQYLQSGEKITPESVVDGNSFALFNTALARSLLKFALRV